MDVVVDVVDIVVVGNVSGSVVVDKVVAGDVDKVVVVVGKVVVDVDKVVVVVGKVVVVVDKVVVVVDKVVVDKVVVVVDNVVVGKVVVGKVVVGKVVVGKVVVDISVGNDAVMPPSCPIPKKFRGESGFFGSHITGSLVNKQNLYHLTKKEDMISKLNAYIHMQSFLIGVEYRNCCQTLDIYLLFAIWMGQIQSKLIYIHT